MATGNFPIGLTLVCIALLLFLILFVRLHAFLALILTSMTLGLASGMAPLRVLRSIQTGFGEALGFIAIVVALGAIIGKFLEYSGGGGVLAGWLLDRFGRDRAPWAVLVSAFLVGLPIFFEVGFIILLPIVLSLTRESKKSLLYFGLPTAAALTVTHSLVPPHPAPAAAAQLFGANLGRMILLGALVSIPMAIAGGIVYGLWISKRMYIRVPARPAGVDATAHAATKPRAGAVLLLVSSPILLIFAGTLAEKTGGRIRISLEFLGHPFTALAVTAVASMYFFGSRQGLDRAKMARMTADALLPIGALLAIMGGGGAFKQVIVDSGVGSQIGRLIASSSISPLLVAYLVAAAMRAAQGSATVAIITAAGILAPLVRDIPGYSPEFMVLALCCGGTLISHVNDAGFWLVNESYGMTVSQTLRSWTAMKVITSIVGIAIVLAAHALLRGR
jgi:gluconate transporter